jgi:CDP-diacylglycerol--glycerol-3-phosphate 3-phosphatidyltransferase
MNKSQNNLNNLPNTLSVMRLAFIPVIVICLYFPGRLGSFLAALFFGAAAITDLLDGFYARKHKKITSLGKFLDPLADKLLVSVTMIMLITLNRIPAWVVILKWQ